mmetsp:Transcript_133024/g.284358  ORF Transcript_133024/g.284358 Transcript_133024/m.284358 type:complete len:211 (+) Transcript_133024:831-1463(+)
MPCTIFSSQRPLVPMPSTPRVIARSRHRLSKFVRPTTSWVLLKRRHLLQGRQVSSLVAATRAVSQERVCWAKGNPALLLEARFLVALETHFPEIANRRQPKMATLLTIARWMLSHKMRSLTMVSRPLLQDPRLVVRQGAARGQLLAFLRQAPHRNVGPLVMATCVLLPGTRLLGTRKVTSPGRAANQDKPQEGSPLAILSHKMSLLTRAR